LLKNGSCAPVLRYDDEIKISLDDDDDDGDDDECVMSCNMQSLVVGVACQRPHITWPRSSSNG